MIFILIFKKFAQSEVVKKVYDHYKQDSDKKQDNEGLEKAAIKALVISVKHGTKLEASKTSKRLGNTSI